MVMDIDHQSFKFVWYQKPEKLGEEMTLQYCVGDHVDVSERNQLSFSIDSYQHNTQKYGIDPLIVRVGEKNAVLQQLEAMLSSLELSEGQGSPFKFVVNIDKMLPSTKVGQTTETANIPSQKASSNSQGGYKSNVSSVSSRGGASSSAPSVVG